MLGLFSFREMTVGSAIDFWLAFCERVNLFPHEVTIHPDKMEVWSPLYRGRVPIRPDVDCQWSDGEISGYCTEFYRDGVEIGNIVNALGTCIDCGFGAERMASLREAVPTPDIEAVLVDAITSILDAGYRPGPKEQGYVLRKLLRTLRERGGALDHPLMVEEEKRQERAVARYRQLLPSHRDKSPAWWWDTHGINVAELQGFAGAELKNLHH